MKSTCGSTASWWTTAGAFGLIGRVSSTWTWLFLLFFTFVDGWSTCDASHIIFCLGILLKRVGWAMMVTMLTWKSDTRFKRCRARTKGSHTNGSWDINSALAGPVALRQSLQFIQFIRQYRFKKENRLAVHLKLCCPPHDSGSCNVL